MCRDGKEVARPACHRGGGHGHPRPAPACWAVPKVPWKGTVCCGACVVPRVRAATRSQLIPSEQGCGDLELWAISWCWGATNCFHISPMFPSSSSDGATDTPHKHCPKTGAQEELQTQTQNKPRGPKCFLQPPAVTSLLLHFRFKKEKKNETKPPQNTPKPLGFLGCVQTTTAI